MTLSRSPAPPRGRYRRDLDDAILEVAAGVVAGGGTPSAWEVGLRLGEPESTVRRHRESLIDRGLWPWPVRVGRPPKGTGSAPPPAPPTGADADADLPEGPRLTLMAARRVAGDGAGAPTARAIARAVGWSTTTIRRHRDMLVAMGRWPWPVEDATPAAPPAPAPARPPRPGDDVGQAAADLWCEAHQGQAHPLQNDDARPWEYRRAHAPGPASAGQVAARESERRRGLVRRWLREWRRIRPGVARA